MRGKCHECMPSTQTGAHCLDFPTHLAKVRPAVQQRDCVVGVVEVAAVQLHELDEQDTEVERRRPRLILDPRMQLAGEGGGVLAMAVNSPFVTAIGTCALLA
jgi:hypothetical protein